MVVVCVLRVIYVSLPCYYVMVSLLLCYYGGIDLCVWYYHVIVVIFMLSLC